METASHAYQSHENEPPIDLFEHYADHEANFGGRVATFRDLKDLCPVDLTNPDITTETMNNYFVKFASKAGLEIEPQHEPVFRTIATEQGINHAFTVTETVTKTPKESAPHRVTMEAIVEPDVIQEAPPEQVQPTQIQPVTLERSFVPQPQPNQTTVTEIVHLFDTSQPETLSHEIPDINQPVVYSTVAAPTPEATTTTITLSEQASPLSQNSFEATANTATDERPDITELQAYMEWNSEPETITHENSMLVENFEAEAAPELQLPAPYVIDRTEYSNEIIQPVVQSEVWLRELSLPPTEQFNNFTQALLSYHSFENTSTDDTVEQAEASPVQVLAERLTSLENAERETVFPQLEQVIGAIHGYQILREQQAPEAELQALELQINTLCEQLVATLELDMSPDDIKRLTHILIDLYATPAPTILEATVISDTDGMHERKTYWHQQYSLGSQLLASMHRLLGSSALVHLQPARQ